MKSKDYEPGMEIEASSPYSAWKQLAGEGAPLRPGDLLEGLQNTSGAVLQIAKYIGFEPAQWFVPEPKPENSASPEAAFPAQNEQAFSNNIP